MPVRFEDENPPTSPARIDDFEKENGIRLPDSYRRFLLDHNGGAPLPDRIRVPGWPGGFTGFNTFFGIDGDDDLQDNLDAYEDRIPPGFVPIGDDPGGGLFCLALSGPHEGEIYFWDHEDELDEEGDSKQDMSNMYRVAEGMDDLLENRLLPDE